MILKGIAQNW